jgi:hypothetical protein
MANTYTYSGPGTRWAEGDPTSEDKLNIARINLDHVYEALNTIMDTDAADGAVIGAVSLANDANNRLVTADGTGGVKGEANATFDGSLLDITGAIRTSTGIRFGTDTAAANTLDDYEEGTWTAGLTASTSGTITVNTSQDLMKYTKVGNLVTVMGDVRVSSVSSPVGVLRITGLPFTVSSGAELSDRTACAVNTTVLGSAINTPMGQVDAGDTSIRVFEFNGTTEANMADKIQASTEIVINMTYSVS